MKRSTFFRLLLRFLFVSVLMMCFNKGVFILPIPVNGALLTAAEEVVLVFAIGLALESIVESLQKKYRNKRHTNT